MKDIEFTLISSDDSSQFDRRQACRAFSRVGLAFVLLLAVWNGVDIGLVYLASSFWPQVAEATWFLLLVNAVSLYGVGFPVFYLVLKRLPVPVREQHNLGAGRFMISLMMCYAMLIAGNIVGLIVTGLIQFTTGQETANTAYDLLTSGENLAVLLISVGVLAPIFEELMCRRMIIDRLRIYGQKTAILVSSLAFAALHGNLSQFFYAFVLGLFFGYLYLRTGKLRYTIFLHMIINVFSTLLSAVASGVMDFLNSGVTDILTADLSVLLRVMLMGFMTMLEYGCALAGLILLIIYRKHFVLPGGEERLIPKGERLQVVLLNPGILTALLFTAVFFTLGYFV